MGRETGASRSAFVVGCFGFSVSLGPDKESAGWCKGRVVVVSSDGESDTGVKGSNRGFRKAGSNEDGSKEWSRVGIDGGVIVDKAQ